MERMIDRAIRRLELGEARSFGGLTVWPLLGGPTNGGGPAYVTLDEALRAGTFRAGEVGTSGHVPELQVVNEGDRPVLLLDGEELVGAKQNRVLNITVLVPAGGTLVVPVSCVEAGRWSFEEGARGFTSADHVMYLRARRAKSESVRRAAAAGHGYRSNQGEVWDAIADKMLCMSAPSATAAMRDVYRQHRTGVNDYVGAFPAVDRQLGAVFALRSAVAGMELFDHARTLGAMLPKLVRSYALDALELELRRGEGWRSPRRRMAHAVPDRDAAGGFLCEVGERARVEVRSGIGLGHDVRLSGARVVGGALVHDDAVVHLTAFRTEDAGSTEDGGGSRFSRWSWRRRQRS